MVHGLETIKKLNQKPKTKYQWVHFYFRIWLDVEDGDPPEIEVWYNDLENTEPGNSFISDWAKETLSYENFYKLFDEVDKNKKWQIVGEARLRGWFDYWGEYDEELNIVSFKKKEVNRDYYDYRHDLIDLEE